MRRLRTLFLTLTAGLVAGLILFVAPAAPSSPLVVATTSGKVGGILVGAVKEWRGVPYAAPPVGSLRWRPPAAVTSWSGVRDTTSFAPECIQLALDENQNVVTAGSEDCLYLNVFVPSSATSSSHLAVMVHLHPGSNVFGDAYQDPGAFPSRNVIVVTVGYRLGVFGFMGHPALTTEGGGQSGEYAALDQLAALRWVHNNIAAFGGDPASVTLFGSSAGSFDTVALMASPLSAGLITRAAVQGASFFALTANDVYTVPQAEFFGGLVASSVGCGSANDVLSCLRSVPASTLVFAADSVGATGFDSPPVGSSVLPASSVLQLLSQGSNVPLLVGFDREEDAGFFERSLQDPYSPLDYVKDSATLVGPNLAGQARSLYPASAYDSLLWAYITMRTDAVRGCPTRRLANTVVGQAPVWRYLYTHVDETDPGFSLFHASHVFEEQYLWGADVFDWGYVLSPAEQLLSQRMTDYWTNFAKTGNPNGFGLPNWPRYNSTTEPTLTLDDQVGVIGNYHDQQCALLDTIFEPFPFPIPHFGRGVGPMTLPPGVQKRDARRSS